MGLIYILLSTALQLFGAVLDLIMMFVIVRAITRRWKSPWIIAIDLAGRPIVDPILRQARDNLKNCSERSLRDPAILALLLVLLLIARGIVAWMRAM